MSDTRLGTELAGYRIESLLGRGGMSVVYLAEDLRLKRRAALKVLAPELAQDANFRERFISESELAASLDHPNVIPIFEAGEAGGVLFIAMRYVESTDLKALIRREGRLTPERSLSIVGQAASALDAAHKQGLVHRDVKPANLLVAEGQGAGGTDHVYVADFGLAKRAQQRTGLTRTGQFVGTVDYVAPEQIEGKDIDGRTDEYALACVLYECLAGDSPYPKDDETQVLIAHLMDPVPSVRAIRPDLPEALDRVIQAGMAKSKESRFPDCVSFVKAASAAMRGSGPVAVPAPAFEAPPGPVTGETPPAQGVAATAPGVGGMAGAGTTVPSGPPPFTAPPSTAGGTFQPAPATLPTKGAPRPPRRRKNKWVNVLISAVIAGAVAALLVVLLNKGGNSGPSTNPSGGTTSGQATSGPSNTPKTFAPGTVIYTDDFSDNSGKWDQTTEGRFKDGFSNGVYFQQILKNPDANGIQVFAASTARAPEVDNLGDVTVEVTATKTAGDEQNGYGIACRTGGGTNSYYFVIGSTGGWAIEKSLPGAQPVLKQGTDQFIRKGDNAPNDIQGTCVGGTNGTPVTLTLVVNGHHVGQVQDTPGVDVSGDASGVYAAGTIGMVSVGNKDLRVEFDNLKVVAAG